MKRILLSAAVSSGRLPAATTILVLLVPKCPLCWTALASSVGAGAALSSASMRAVVAALLMLAVAALLARAVRTASYQPFVIGAIAAAAIYVFKFRLDDPIGASLGAAALISSSIWSAAKRKRAEAPSPCDSCASHLRTHGGEHG